MMPEPTKTAQKTGAKTVTTTKATTPTGAAAAPGAVDNAPAGGDAQLERELDRLSLEQAVRDFEIANSRVVDLTQRLISANQHIVELQRLNDISETTLVEVQTRYAEVVASRAYQLAQRAGAIRSLLRR
jgi:hypothetical protein